VKTSREVKHIVQTVLNAFLPLARDAVCGQAVLSAVLRYIEGDANQATTRCELRSLLRGINLEADDEGLDLCIETAHGLAWGYSHWLQGQQSPDVLDFYPALELAGVHQRDEAVDWIERWRRSGGRLFAGNRMVALKGAQIWTHISAFHLPFPPFDLGSWVELEEISREEAGELGLLSKGDAARSGVIDLDFGEALRSRLEFYLGAEGQRQRFEKEVERADGRTLLQMAEERIDCDEDRDAEAIRDAIFILGRAIERGMLGEWEGQAKAFGLLSEAHALIHQPEAATAYRSKQLETFEAWIASGIPTGGDQRARVYSQVAEIYLHIGQPGEAAHYRQLAEDSRTGSSLFFEARQRVEEAGGMNAELATEVAQILDQAIKRGFSDNLQDEVNAYGLLAAAHDVLQHKCEAGHCRAHQLAGIEAWIGKGIPTESDRRSKAYGQAADICEKLGEKERAAAFRHLRDEARDGLSLLSEALADLKACGKQIERGRGAEILDKLTKSANRIPQSLPEQHAEIYRAAGRILDAWGDTVQAIEYYEYALAKNPKIAVKGRLGILRRRANKATAEAGPPEQL